MTAFLAPLKLKNHIMKFTQLLFIPALLAATCFLFPSQANAQTDVIAFWDFGTDFDFADGFDGPNAQDFPASEFGVDNTVSNNANFQAFLGDAANLDCNGGGGFVSYTSPVSGITVGPSRTVKWDDIRGGGDDFDINGQTIFNVIRGDNDAAEDDFGNDALIYLTFDATGFQDLQFRFDIEGTPGQPDPNNPNAEIEDTLPTQFDVFIRTTGPNGTWFRPDELNNIEIEFFDYDPVDPENQFGETGYISLGSALDNASQVEIIFNDFDGETANDEMEIDNFEIVGNVASVLLGDINRDGVVDFQDIPLFVGAITAGDFLAEADIDQSGEVDFLDIVPFINILTGS